MDYLKTANSVLKAGKGINITPTYKTFDEENNIVCGRFLASSDVQSTVSGGTYKQYLFDTDEGLIKFHMGSAADNEAGAVMEINKVYHIHFLGKELIGNSKSVNKYHIEEIPYEHKE